MSEHISAKDLYDKAYDFTIDTYPHECPVCHTSLHPKLVDCILHTHENLHLLQVAFRCTKPVCGHLFIATYKCRTGKPWELSDVQPQSPIPHTFPAEVQKISPLFVTIFNQTIVSESKGLDQLTGIGLRKAIEFLIKDFNKTGSCLDKRQITIDKSDKAL